MRKTNIRLVKKLFTFCSIFLLQGCSFTALVGDISNSTRKGPEKITNVQFVFSPTAVFDISKNAEYFNHLRNANIEAETFKEPLMDELKSLNIQCRPFDSTRFLITITSLSFNERTKNECELDEYQNKQCFLLNDLSIYLKMNIQDRLNNEERKFSFNVSESSTIKKRLIGSGLTERTFGMDYDKLRERLITKAAGKAAQHIRKKT